MWMYMRSLWYWCEDSFFNQKLLSPCNEEKISDGSIMSCKWYDYNNDWWVKKNLIVKWVL